MISNIDRRMARASGILLAVTTLAGARALAADVGYTLDVTTLYQYGAPANVLNGYSGGPDTGFFTIQNDGSSTFTGTIGDIAHAGNGGDYSFTSAPLTLAPGQSATFGVNNESSNQGGYNGPTGSAQPGVQIDISGSIALGANSEGVNLSVNDADIHSGVPRTSPGSGLVSDSYVLQGGDPRGNDNGDAYETTQANGQYRFFQPASGVPEASSTVAMLGMALAGLAGLRRRFVK